MRTTLIIISPNLYDIKGNFVFKIEYLLQLTYFYW